MSSRPDNRTYDNGGQVKAVNPKPLSINFAAELPLSKINGSCEQNSQTDPKALKSTGKTAANFRNSEAAESAVTAISKDNLKIMPAQAERADFFSEDNDTDMIAEITGNIKLDQDTKAVSVETSDDRKDREQKSLKESITDDRAVKASGTEVSDRDVLTKNGKSRIVLVRSSEDVKHQSGKPESADCNRQPARPWSLDVEIALCDLLGDAPASSRISFEQMALDWKRGYEAYFSRPLTEERFPYIWADVKQFDLGNKIRKSYLSLVGCNTSGERKLLALRETESDSEEVWEMLAKRLERRDLGNPRLFIGRAGLPLWNAIPRIFPRAAIQFCWNDFRKKTLGYFPEEIADEVDRRLMNIQFAETKQDAENWIEYFKKSFGRNYLRAVNELLKNRNKLLNFYSFPRQHWDELRSGGFIEARYPSRALLRTVCKYEGMRDITLYLVFHYLTRSRAEWGRLKARSALRNVQNGLGYFDGRRASSRRLKRINIFTDNKVEDVLSWSKAGLLKVLSGLFSKKPGKTGKISGEPGSAANPVRKPEIDTTRSAPNSSQLKRNALRSARSGMGDELPKDMSSEKL